MHQMHAFSLQMIHFDPKSIILIQNPPKPIILASQNAPNACIFTPNDPFWSKIHHFDLPKCSKCMYFLSKCSILIQNPSFWPPKMHQMHVFSLQMVHFDSKWFKIHHFGLPKCTKCIYFLSKCSILTQNPSFWPPKMHQMHVFSLQMVDFDLFWAPKWTDTHHDHGNTHNALYIFFEIAPASRAQLPTQIIWGFFDFVLKINHFFVKIGWFSKYWKLFVKTS